MHTKTFGFVFLTFMFLAAYGWGQAYPATPEARAAQTGPVTAENRVRIEKAVLSDARVQKVVGTEKPRILVSEAHVDKAEAEAFLAGTTEKQPAHFVNVVIFNPRTNKAVHALMSLEQERILEVQEIEAVDVPLTREDADDALALAKANPDVRRAVGANLERFVILEPGSDQRAPFAAEVLPVRSSDRSDPCSTDRCLDLVFRTETGYLPFRASVDLTRHTVRLSSSQHAGGRQ
ncbi:MAG TPA: hypothetical protein VI685_08415 [Candidatus Angelobacter sp.]